MTRVLASQLRWCRTASLLHSPALCTLGKEAQTGAFTPPPRPRTRAGAVTAPPSQVRREGEMERCVQAGGKRQVKVSC